MSIRMAAMEPDSIRVTRSVVLPLAEVELRFSRSSGPGGQHANTAETRVEAILDVEASSALTDAQKRRVLAKAGPTLRAIAQDERSQWRNRELAVERLVEQLRKALKVERRRVATKPTKASRERRLESKKRRSADEEAPPSATPDSNRTVRCLTRSVDVLRLASLLEELPPERTRLLDNLGRLRREVGPITPELSDALADRMNLRHGDVHEVVSFYSFLQVPVDAVRVCTGPVCDCAGSRSPAHGRRDRGALPRPLRPRAGRPARRRRRSAASPTRRTASCSSPTTSASRRS